MTDKTVPVVVEPLDEFRINAMLETLQNQRDSYANQVVHLSGELAFVNFKLTKALKALKGADPPEVAQ